MKIAAFGSTYAGAYVFPTYKAFDDLTTERPSSIQRVGGVSGAFDFIGLAGNPIMPQTVRKSFEIVASTYAGVETALDTARASLLAADGSKLWALMRDGSKRWTWAKVTAFSAPESVSTRLTIPVTVEFLCRDGLWYNETAHTQHVNDGTSTVLANAGNSMAALTAGTGGVTAISATSVNNTTNGSGWSFDLSSTAAYGITVYPASYQVVDFFGLTDFYPLMTVNIPSELWLRLSPGNNTIVTASTGGTANGWDFEWYDTWVM